MNQNQPQLQLNIGQYIADKAAGIAKLVKLNGEAFYSVKEFDRAGKPKVQNVPLAKAALEDLVRNIEADIAERQTNLASVKQVLADIDAAPEALDILQP